MQDRVFVPLYIRQLYTLQTQPHNVVFSHNLGKHHEHPI